MMEVVFEVIGLSGWALGDSWKEMGNQGGFQGRGFGTRKRIGPKIEVFNNVKQ